MKKLILILASMLAVMAADVAGEWKATAEGPNGSMERTLSLKVDGDSITFTITAKIQDNEMKISYKGKVTGKDTMTVSSEAGGNSFEWKATRVK